MKKLEKLIKEKKAKVAIIGLGYVGLPHAVEIAKAGFSVFGIDIQKKRVNLVNKGISYIDDIKNKEIKEVIKEKKLKAFSDFLSLKKADVIIICVPTPLDKYKIPDISYVESSAKEIKKYFHKGKLIILESTTYPGTTEEVLLPMLENKKFKAGKDFSLAFAPERIDPGNTIPFEKIPKVVGGITRKCTKLTALFYRQFLEKVHSVSSPKTAEMTKLLENTYRLINISAINELSLFCGKIGVDIWEVIEAAKTKPYGFHPFYPSARIGGHCFDKNQKVFIKSQSSKLELIKIKDLFLRYAFNQQILEVPSSASVLVGTRGGNTDQWQNISPAFTQNKNLNFIFPKKIKVLSFNLEKQNCAFENIEVLSRRKIDKKIKIKTYYNHKLKVTEDHPVIIFNGKDFQTKLAKNIIKDDKLVLSRQIPNISHTENIDLIETILKKGPLLVQKIRVRPIKKQIKDFRKYLDPIFYGNDIKQSYYSLNFLPLSVFLKIEKKLEIPRNELLLLTGRGPSFSKIPTVLTIDKDFGRLIGYYLSEGCITEEKKTSRIRFTFSKDEKEYINDVENILEKKGIKYSTWKDPQWNNFHIKVSSYILSLVFKDILGCGKNCYEMKIPDQIFFSNSLLRKEVLKGLLRGDGGVEYKNQKQYYQKNGKNYYHNSNKVEISYFTSSPILFEQVCLILLETGVMFRKYKREGLLGITGPENVKKLRGIFAGEKEKKLEKYLKNIRKKNDYHFFKIYPKFFSLKIKEIKTEPEEEVFSLEVKNTNTLITDSGIVAHNCIPLDPFYLSWKAKEYNFWARFIELAGEINELMPHYIVVRTASLLNKYKKAIKGSKILVWGVAYKKDIADSRESAANEIIPELLKKGAVVDYFDPYNKKIKIKNKELKSIKYTPPVLKKYDLLLILTDHSGFDYDDIAKKSKLVVDTRNAIKSRKYKNVSWW